jgi:type VI protein secretion system component VasF
MFDLDAFEERAAIMEFDGGLSRFRAETAAAQAQGVSRHEAIRIRNSQQTRDQRQAAERDAADAMPRVQPRQAKEIRPVPVRELLTGWCGLALLALHMVGGRVL